MTALRTWVIIADAGMVRIYQNTGHQGRHEALLEPVEGGEFHRDQHHGRPDQGPAGRGFAHTGASARHAASDDESRRRTQESGFFRMVFAWLSKPEQRSRFRQIIVAAPPRALGEIRLAMPADLAAICVHEIHADLSKSPIKEIEDHVSGHFTAVAAPRD